MIFTDILKRYLKLMISARCFITVMLRWNV